MTHADVVQVRADMFSGEMLSDCCNAEAGFEDGEIGLCSECREWASLHRADDPDYI